MHRLNFAKTFIPVSLQISRLGCGKQMNRYIGWKFKYIYTYAPQFAIKKNIYIYIPFKLRSGENIER